MIAKSTWTMVALLLTLPLVGQEKPAQTPLPAVPDEQIKVRSRENATAKAAEMTEDVEILRLLLNKSLGLPRKPATVNHYGGNPPTFASIQDLAAGPGSIPSSTGMAFFSPQVANPPAESFDGVYLKGHGVAYTIRLSMAQSNLPPHEKAAGLAVTCQNCHAAEAVAKFNLIAVSSTAKPPTDWEKARDELRGVRSRLDPNATKPNVADMCAPGNLTESVTKLLGANGRHLRHLAAGENVSVVITYDGLTGGAHDRATGTMADPNLWNPKAGESTVGTKIGFTPDEAKQIVLGDLHLKQQKFADAAKAYQSALNRYADAVNTIAPPPGVKAADLASAVEELQSNVALVYRWLAQAHIGAGELDEARRALELAKNVQIKIGGSDRKIITPVPTKIILTVKKSHLDAAEKLAPAEFRKGVTVETVGLSVGKK